MQITVKIEVEHTLVLLRALDTALADLINRRDLCDPDYYQNKFDEIVCVRELLLDKVKPFPALS